MPGGRPRGMACALNFCRAKALRRSQGFSTDITEEEAEEILQGAIAQAQVVNNAGETDLVTRPPPAVTPTPALTLIADEDRPPVENTGEAAPATPSTLEAHVLDAIREAELEDALHD